MDTAMLPQHQTPNRSLLRLPVSVYSLVHSIIFFALAFAETKATVIFPVDEELPRPPKEVTVLPPAPMLFANHDDRMRVLGEVSRFGLEEADNLYDGLEPTIYTQGVFLDRNEPARYHAAINSLEPMGKTLARAAYASLQATHSISDRFYLSKQQIISGLAQVNVTGSPLSKECPMTIVSHLCTKRSDRYRNFDGSCNNRPHPSWGQARRPFFRFLLPEYNDGISSVRRSVIGGQLLPSPRRVSSVVHRDEDHPNGRVTLLLMQWGQFLDHDLTFTPMSRGFNSSAIKCCNVRKELKHPDCLPIYIPPSDYFYGQYNRTCMEFVRSSPAPSEDCSLGPRNQINQATSFLDASTVYGTGRRQAKELRTRQKGLLKIYRVGMRKPLLPHNFESNPNECKETGNRFCFQAGDSRVNEQPGLASIHTLWLREHNRLARQLSRINPHWEDDRLFQEARRIVIAEMQHISYNEFLPVVLGPTIIRLFELGLKPSGYFRGYNPSINPSVANVFGAAVFRFGHSLVQDVLQRCDKRFQPMKPEIPLQNELMKPDVLHNFGAVDRLLLGLSAQPIQQRDEFVTQQLSNHLFQRDIHRYGLDLISLNIQRGRDHGLPSYVSWRDYCGLRRPKEFEDLRGLMDDATVNRFRRLYKSVDDVDLFPAGMAEKPVVGGLVGPTFACLMGQTFQKLRKGDRFWYENGGQVSSFKLEQLEELRHATFARVLCNNLDDIDVIQPFVMKVHQSNKNRRVSCQSPRIPFVNLSLWKEEPFHPISRPAQTNHAAGNPLQSSQVHIFPFTRRTRPSSPPYTNYQVPPQAPQESAFKWPQLPSGIPWLSLISHLDISHQQEKR